MLRTSEIRTVAADGLWLSPSRRRDAVGIHFTRVKDTDAVRPVLAAIEQQLVPFAARPHWGKLLTTSPGAVRGLYARSADFQQLMCRFDAAGKLRNDMVDRHSPAA